MIIAEYLKQNKFEIDLNIPVELKDVIDDREVHCKDYDTLIKELHSIGYEHVNNARYIDTQQTENLVTVFYMKNTNDYSNFDLMQLLQKLQGDVL